MDLPVIEVVPDLAAEEVVTIDSDDSSDSSEILSVHSVQRTRFSDEETSIGHTDDTASNDEVSSFIGALISRSEPNNMSEHLLEIADSSDDHISDSDSDQMVHTSSSESTGMNLVQVQSSNINNAAISGSNASDSHSRPDLRNFMSVSLNSSLDCFKSPKKLLKTSVELPVKSDSLCESGEDEECCPICFEPWTNSGFHRLASLRCGHLFGQSCIEKWLKGDMKKCPQCNVKAHRKDVRVLFARSLKTVDTTERDRALEELTKEKEARRNAELEAAKARMHHQMALNECHQLRQELERERQKVETLRKSASSCGQGGFDVDAEEGGSQKCNRGSYMFEKTVKVHEAGGCRVLSYCSQMATLCISQQTSNALFPGFGVKKISVLDFKTFEFVWVHSKAIRDLSFNKQTSDATLLSCSIDKSIRLTSLHSNKIMQTYDCQYPVWSCVWDADDKNCFYAGLQNGSVYAFDVRNLSEPTQQLNQDVTSRSPVVSLQYLPIMSGNSPRSGGLLVGQLDRSSFHEKQTSGNYKVHLLPLEANLTSLSLEESTCHVLASHRPSVRCPNVRHQVYELAFQSSFNADTSSLTTDCSCHSVHTFYSGATQKLLAKSRLIRPPGGDLLACSGDEASLSVYVWNAGTGQLLQKMSTSDPVLDICSVTVNDQSFLAALTEKVVNVYRWK